MVNYTSANRNSRARNGVRNASFDDQEYSPDSEIDVDVDTTPSIRRKGHHSQEDSSRGRRRASPIPSNDRSYNMSFDDVAMSAANRQPEMVSADRRHAVVTQYHQSQRNTDVAAADIEQPNEIRQRRNSGTPAKTVPARQLQPSNNAPELKTDPRCNYE